MFRVCKCCGAALDPGEICDCTKEEAASGDANTESGTEKISTNSINGNGGKVNGENKKF